MPNAAPDHRQEIVLTPLPRDPDWKGLGPFRLEGAWQVTSRNADFGGYSAILAVSGDEFLALSDGGQYLRYPRPGASGPVEIGALLATQGVLKHYRDVEAATRDPRTGTFWVALEGRNAIIRLGPDRQEQAARQIPEMQGWGSNTGPEAMVRLADGRFLVLSEAFTSWSEAVRHPGLLFTGDPTGSGAAPRFIFTGPIGYRPTDLAQLPDGRVLVLMRRLLWPFPARFAAKIVLADPALLEPGRPWRSIELADLSAPLPVDNFEALAIEPDGPGSVTVWLMSDDNAAATQRTLLWKLDLRLADLPPRQSKGRGEMLPPRP
ncbi:esterase-like activity of phytase family protein [Novosphingobium sp.]|uniref:esterase-like activity of phytase family protein n=1 Tax=Novosphingobium sp. TaxID=1874826 RepID=UPI002619D1D0|nr:esterase-like activity of phytase family protein [Novosphingobium sp.]